MKWYIADFTSTSNTGLNKPTQQTRAGEAPLQIERQRQKRRTGSGQRQAKNSKRTIGKGKGDGGRVEGTDVLSKYCSIYRSGKGGRRRRRRAGA
jgi:hypothetical protein